MLPAYIAYAGMVVAMLLALVVLKPRKAPTRVIHSYERPLPRKGSATRAPGIR